MHGLHLTADLHDCSCDPDRLTDASRLDVFGQRIVREHGLTIVGHLAHAFPATPRGAGGVTAAWMLAESHVCLHTWPEQGAVTVDVYVCNSSADHSTAARAVMDAWTAFFQPAHVERHELQRGSLA